MTITSQIEIREFRINYVNRCATFILDEVFYREDNSVASRKQVTQNCFEPGMIDKVKTFLGKEDSKEIRILNDYWTDDIIEEHNREISN
jgi:hypothetical protein